MVEPSAGAPGASSSSSAGQKKHQSYWEKKREENCGSHMAQTIFFGSEQFSVDCLAEVFFFHRSTLKEFYEILRPNSAAERCAAKGLGVSDPIGV